MEEIIESIFAAVIDDDALAKAEKEFHRQFIEGGLNESLKDDVESLNVKKLNILLNNILEDDYPIEDKIKAIEQWDDIMTNYVKYMEELRDKTMEGYDNLCKKYHEKEK